MSEQVRDGPGAPAAGGPAGSIKDLLYCKPCFQIITTFTSNHNSTKAGVLGEGSSAHVARSFQLIMDCYSSGERREDLGHPRNDLPPPLSGAGTEAWGGCDRPKVSGPTLPVLVIGLLPVLPHETSEALPGGVLGKVCMRVKGTATVSLATLKTEPGLTSYPWPA